MKKNITIYNIVLLGLLYYSGWGLTILIILIPLWITGAFCIISAISNIENKRIFFSKNLGKVVLCSYLSILIGIAAEFLINWFVLELHLKISDYGDEWYKTVPAILIAGGLTFVFAKFVIFKKLEKGQSTKIALALALSTAPYWLMIPTGLFFHH